MNRRLFWVHKYDEISLLSFFFSSFPFLDTHSIGRWTAKIEVFWLASTRHFPTPVAINTRPPPPPPPGPCGLGTHQRCDTRYRCIQNTPQVHGGSEHNCLHLGFFIFIQIKTYGMRPDACLHRLPIPKYECTHTSIPILHCPSTAPFIDVLNPPEILPYYVLPLWFQQLPWKFLLTSLRMHWRMAVDLHKYYFRYIVSYLVNIYIYFMFPEIKTA